jgi:hypothetical protein
MAKNLLEQFLDFATSKLTGPLGDDIYIKEETEVNTGLTGVARYLAKQEQAAQAAAALTGVEKYLARQAQAAKPASVVEAKTAAPESPVPMSRVERYLASQAASKPAEAEVAAEPVAPQEPAAPLSRVARYLASQTAAANKPAVTEAAAEPVAQESTAPLSRVAKYLASQTASKPAATEAVAEPAAPLSRVARYLASQTAAAKPTETVVEPSAASQEPAAPLSRVAKYLASQQAASAPAGNETVAEPAAPAAEEVAQESGAPLSRVAKYLAAVSKEFKPEVGKKTETAPEAEAAPASRTGVSKYLASQNKSVAESTGIASVAQVIKDLGKIEAPSEEIEISLDDESVSGSDNVIRLDEGTQCQASTAKGTQCKNKSNLGHIQLTVNDQEYRFSVCTQHNNENFKPFAELLES